MAEFARCKCTYCGSFYPSTIEGHRLLYKCVETCFAKLRSVNPNYPYPAPDEPPAVQHQPPPPPSNPPMSAIFQQQQPMSRTLDYPYVPPNDEEATKPPAMNHQEPPPPPKSAAVVSTQTKFRITSAAKLTNWAYKFITKYGFYEKGLEAKTIADLTQKAEGGDKNAMHNLQNMTAFIPRCLFFTKRAAYVATLKGGERLGEKEDHRPHHAIRILSASLLNVDDPIVRGFLDDLELFKNALAAVIRDEVKAALLKLVNESRKEQNLNLFHSTDQIVDLSKKSPDFVGQVMDLFGHKLYGKKNTSGEFKRADLETRLLEYCQIQYLEGDLRVQSCLRTHINEKIDDVRKPYRAIRQARLKNATGTTRATTCPTLTTDTSTVSSAERPSSHPTPTTDTATVSISAERPSSRPTLTTDTATISSAECPSSSPPVESLETLHNNDEASLAITSVSTDNSGSPFLSGASRTSPNQSEATRTSPPNHSEASSTFSPKRSQAKENGAPESKIDQEQDLSASLSVGDDDDDSTGSFVNLYHASLVHGNKNRKEEKKQKKKEKKQKKKERKEEKKQKKKERKEEKKRKANNTKDVDEKSSKKVREKSQATGKTTTEEEDKIRLANQLAVAELKTGTNGKPTSLPVSTQDDPQKAAVNKGKAKAKSTNKVSQRDNDKSTRSGKKDTSVEDTSQGCAHCNTSFDNFVPMEARWAKDYFKPNNIPRFSISLGIQCISKCAECDKTGQLLNDDFHYCKGCDDNLKELRIEDEEDLDDHDGLGYTWYCRECHQKIKKKREKQEAGQPYRGRRNRVLSAKAAEAAEGE